MRKMVAYKSFLLVITVLAYTGYGLASTTALQLETDSEDSTNVSVADSMSVLSSHSDDEKEVSEDGLESPQEYAYKVFSSYGYTDRTRLDALFLLLGQKRTSSDLDLSPVLRDTLTLRVHVIPSRTPLSLKEYLDHILFSKITRESYELEQDPYLSFRYICLTEVYWPYVHGGRASKADIRRYFIELVRRHCISPEQAHFMRYMEPWKEYCFSLDPCMTAKKCGGIVLDRKLGSEKKWDALNNLRFFSPDSYPFFMRKMLDRPVTEQELRQELTLSTRFMLYEHLHGTEQSYEPKNVLSRWEQRGALTHAQSETVLGALAQS